MRSPEFDSPHIKFDYVRLSYKSNKLSLSLQQQIFNVGNWLKKIHDSPRRS